MFVCCPACCWEVGTQEERERELNWQCLHFGRNGVEGDEENQRDCLEEATLTCVFRDKRQPHGRGAWQVQGCKAEEVVSRQQRGSEVAAGVESGLEWLSIGSGHKSQESALIGR